MKDSATLGDASSWLILALRTVEDKIPRCHVDRLGPKGRWRDSDSSDNLFDDDEMGFRNDGFQRKKRSPTKWSSIGALVGAIMEDKSINFFISLDEANYYEMFIIPSNIVSKKLWL